MNNKAAGVKPDNLKNNKSTADSRVLNRTKTAGSAGSASKKPKVNSQEKNNFSAPNSENSGNKQVKTDKKDAAYNKGVKKSDIKSPVKPPHNGDKVKAKPESNVKKDAGLEKKNNTQKVDAQKKNISKKDSIKKEPEKKEHNKNNGINTSPEKKELKKDGAVNTDAEKKDNNKGVSVKNESDKKADKPENIVKKDSSEKVKPELNAFSYFKPLKKPKLKMSSYTVMLVPDSSDAMKSYEFSIDKIAKIVSATVAVLIIVISLIVSFAVKNYRLKNDYSKASKIEELNMENETLKSQNEEYKKLLSESDEKIRKLSEDVNNLELKNASLYIPSIYPYKGTGILITEIVMDKAVTFNCLEGARIVASASGTVKSIEDGLLGTTISIDHGNGYVSQYITKGKIDVNVGDEVIKGEPLAFVNSDDETFSYRVLINGNPDDASKYLDSNN